MFKKYYRESMKEILGSALKPSDGLGDDAVRAKLAELRLTIPRALSEYYSLAGCHWINENHHQLRRIERIEWMDDKLVFMDENQCVVFWGIQMDDLSEADPIVWQGVNGEPIEWYREDYKVSRFLMALWKWTITGKLEDAD